MVHDFLHVFPADLWLFTPPLREPQMDAVGLLTDDEKLKNRLIFLEPSAQLL